MSCNQTDVDHRWPALLLGIELGKFVLGAGEADLEALDLAEPAFPLGLGDAGDQVVADLHEPTPLGRIGAQEGQRTQAYPN